MINEPGTGYWDFSNDVNPQWMDYGSPGARPAPGSITVGGGGNAAPVGAGGAPIGGANPIFSVGPPNPNPNPNTNPNPSQFTPNPFMTPGMTFQPRTQFGQQASAPLNLSQQGRTYGAPLLDHTTMQSPNMAQQLPAFQSVRPGGSSGFMPQFQNPFGPQPQQQRGGEMGLGNMMNEQLRNIYGPPPQAQPQQYRQMGQQPTQISQQPQQPDAAGIAALMRSAMMNKFGNAT